jgi:hypothetical protein
METAFTAIQKRQHTRKFIKQKELVSQLISSSKKTQHRPFHISLAAFLLSAMRCHFSPEQDLRIGV